MFASRNNTHEWRRRTYCAATLTRHFSTTGKPWIPFDCVEYDVWRVLKYVQKIQRNTNTSRLCVLWDMTFTIYIIRKLNKISSRQKIKRPNLSFRLADVTAPNEFPDSIETFSRKVFYWFIRCGLKSPAAIWMSFDIFVCEKKMLYWLVLESTARAKI